MTGIEIVGTKACLVRNKPIRTNVFKARNTLKNTEYHGLFFNHRGWHQGTRKGCALQKNGCYSYGTKQRGISMNTKIRLHHDKNSA